MRLISWNVNGRSGPTLAAQVHALAERDPDVVALQEVRGQSLDLWLDGLHRAGLAHIVDSSALLGRVSSSRERTYRRIYFNVVASRWPLHRLTNLELEFPERYLAANVARPGNGFEIHTAHLPPGSTRGLVKVEMFEALHERLACTSERPRILCGDLNTPRAEHIDGTVEFWGASHPRQMTRWDDAERSVVLGLAEHDLADIFRALHGYAAPEASWVAHRGGKRWGRRYDHVFAARGLAPMSCHYLHAWREGGLSDHSGIEADFAG